MPALQSVPTYSAADYEERSPQQADTTNSSSDLLEWPSPSHMVIPICGLLSLASTGTVLSALFCTKGAKQLCTLALGVCICIQIGTETVLLTAAQFSSHFLSPMLEMTISVFSQLAYMLWPCLLFFSLLCPQRVKNKTAKVGLLCFLAWTVSGIVGLLASQNCYFRLQRRPVPLMLHRCIDPDDWLLEAGLNAFPLALLLLVLCIVITKKIGCCGRGNSVSINVHDSIIPVPSQQHQEKADDLQQPSSSDASTPPPSYGLLFLVLSEFGVKMLRQGGEQPTNKQPQPQPFRHNRQQQNKRCCCRPLTLFLPLAILDSTLRLLAQQLGVWLCKEWRTGGASGDQRWREYGIKSSSSSDHQQVAMLPIDFPIGLEMADSLGHSGHFLLLGLGYSVCLLVSEPKLRKLLRDKFDKVTGNVPNLANRIGILTMANRGQTFNELSGPSSSEI